MNSIKLSVLSYYPSILRTENINVGIIFHNVDTNAVMVKTIKNFKRVASFDDELDIEFFKRYLEGIKSQIATNLFNKNIDFSLEEYTRHFVNNIRCSQVQLFKVEKPDEFIEQSCKFYLKYDYDKPYRLKQKDEFKFVIDFLKSNSIDYSVKPIKGKYNDKVSFDYIIGNYAFRNFAFTGKDISKMIDCAKAWAYNANELKNIYKCIFVFDEEMEESQYYQTIISILKDNAEKVIKLSDVPQFIQNQCISS